MDKLGDAGILFIVSTVVSLIIGRFAIPLLEQLNAGQSIREDGPESHFSKAGTPTIGGIIFLFTLLIVLLGFRLVNLEIIILLISTFGFALVGFVDDYIKVVKKRNLGFTAKQKFLTQILIALILMAFLKTSSTLSTDLYLPFSKRYVDIGLFFIPFIIFVVVGTVNSVNLTDGLDGLSTSVTIVILLFFALVAYKLKRINIMAFSIILAGGLLGFFYYNKYPAKVFMGDTGSLALGGAVVAIALLLNLPLILPIAGGIYFIETLSVIIQVASFKLRGKRIFLMSPLHHHFEQLGYSEKKIVILFFVIEIILCIISYYILF